MKKGLVCIVGIMVFLGGMMLNKAEAAFFEITNPIFGGVTYSPDSNQAGQPTTTVSVGPSGSVSIGMPTAESGSQPIGIYGVGVPLAPLGAAPGYNLAFDINFATYDASDFDAFKAVITQGGYIWSGGSLIGGFSWGGADWPGIEFNVDGWDTQSTVMVSPALDYYVNVVISTSIDTDYPSWGTFSDFSIQAIPEPTSILLLSIGLLGAIGAVRLKKKRS